MAFPLRCERYVSPDRHRIAVLSFCVDNRSSIWKYLADERKRQRQRNWALYETMRLGVELSYCRDGSWCERRRETARFQEAQTDFPAARRRRLAPIRIDTYTSARAAVRKSAGSPCKERSIRSLAASCAPEIGENASICTRKSTILPLFSARFHGSGGLCTNLRPASRGQTQSKPRRFRRRLSECVSRYLPYASAFRLRVIAPLSQLACNRLISRRQPISIPVHLTDFRVSSFQAVAQA